MSKNLRIALIFGGFVTAVGVTLYPLYFYPLTHVDEYKEMQKLNRAGFKQEDVQPTGLKVWSDPFKSK
ncbi:small integral membrane protein 20 [Erpetoichthys calabaricus]|uniref:Small integral membrane protein 20 n=1 Tax=Erpetoichthys calabaricus TaxID=27687 RepID=A0A8C4RT84_ERPCA|nr:small integral membrane protein 20 [Erpetoichthys calabaricus]